MPDLHTLLLEAHAAQDLHRLTDLYAQAAIEAETKAETKYFLTQSYVFALECGHPTAKSLKTQLSRLGAEPPQT